MDDGQFQFSPPTSRRQRFSGTSGQQRARLGRETDVSTTDMLLEGAWEVHAFVDTHI